MIIEVLNGKDIADTMELFCKSFFDDHYYAELFPDVSTKAADMSNAFQETILYCISKDLSLGVKENGKLIGFIICFDYKDVRDNDPAAFRTIFSGKDTVDSISYDNTLHSTVSNLPGTVMYCLSLAVDPEYQRLGIASAMWDRIMTMLPNCSFAGDVSNRASLEIYRRRNFRIEELDEEYYLITHIPSESATTFTTEDKVKLIVPNEKVFAENKIAYSVLKEKTAVSMVNVDSPCGIDVFVKNEEAICYGMLAELSYQAFLEYQRAINVAHFAEIICSEYMYYAQIEPYKFFPLTNDTQKEMVKCRKKEWAVVPDVYVSVPIQYDPAVFEKIEIAAQDDRTNELLQNLDFRTHYEAGIPSSSVIVDDLSSFKQRIVRRYLGKILVQISSENTLSQYEVEGDPIGNPIAIDLFISVDKASESGVLTWYSLSSPFIISQLLDNIIRSQLVVIEEGMRSNFYEYLNRCYGVVRRGTPKAFVVIPNEKKCLSNSQIASLLASETIYPDGESYGEVIDPEITSVVESEYGMGQYDRAYVAAYTNVVLQFSPEMRSSLRDRLHEESITLFYIELILFEEAAIHIADREIIKLFTSVDIAQPIDFLQQVDRIYDGYSKTIDFWDIRVNYPTSQKSIDMLRDAFKIREMLNDMKRNQEHLQLVFDTKCDIVDRRDAKRMDTSLAILSILAVFSAWIDGYDYLSTWSDIFSGDVIYLLQKILFVVVLVTAVYAVTHLFGGKLGLMIRIRRAKNRKTNRKNRK